ncbi:hypothetical protein IFR09_01570 [Pseudomonas syringae]|nr:hypothetical protein [Pseudomonas syringae]MBD8790785.1 hypothetical protein [Pseudomonas syringae]MBD8799023.1 hypothetical protein [Pseudomonas syringae]MBD8809850.1 hypothetical protein [Pseudomonas syringae]
MDVSLNALFNPSTTVNLTRSTESIKTQTDLLDASTVKTLITPAAVYSPDSGSGVSGQPLKPAWTGIPENTIFKAAAAQYKEAYNALEMSYADFKAGLASRFPELADKNFSFTIVEDGSLKAINTGGQLSGQEMEQLESLLNASDSLKTSALLYRDSAIAMVDADAPWGGNLMGEYVLNKENFAKTIDLGALFIERKDQELTSEKVAGWFTSQLWSKGQYEPFKSEVIEMKATDTPS